MRRSRWTSSPDDSTSTTHQRVASNGASPSNEGREAAHRDATFLRRALEETALTSIYLMTFFYWMRDDSPESAATGRFLERWLTDAERLNRRMSGGRAEKPSPRQS
jgi:hypothetical protein